MSVNGIAGSHQVWRLEDGGEEMDGEVPRFC